MKILLLDNYDSFTYNLSHLIEKISDTKVDVIRNDNITISDVEKYTHIVLSPGPGLPNEAGIMSELLDKFKKTKSILGVCLGMQAIGESYGGKLQNLDKVYHGIATSVKLDKKHPLFYNCPDKITVGRYHSWVVSKENFPDDLSIISTDDENEIMAISHKLDKVFGVQFHPESILSEYGEVIVKNYLVL
ncbi:MAG: aminodeoxychorismate/anthranilate synthase component II [Bacteroidia bacterium]